jgi:hypothetical protein
VDAIKSRTVGDAFKERYYSMSTCLKEMIAFGEVRHRREIGERRRPGPPNLAPQRSLPRRFRVSKLVGRLFSR